MNNEKASPAIVDNSRIKAHDVKLYTMVFIIYSFCCGGCFGIEEMISSAGPGLTIALLIILVFCWAIPQAFTAAELGSAMPYTGGFYKWIQNALGEFWGFQAGWCRSMAQYAEMAVYVVLAVNYLGVFVELTNLQAYLIKAAIIVVITFINLRGIKEVGWVSTALSLMVLAAFAFATVVGFAHWNANPFIPFFNREEGLGWSISGALATGMWMYSGFTSVSTLAGDCKDKSVVWKGLLFGLPLIALTYILPTIAGVASVGQWQDWSSEGVNYMTVVSLAGAGFGLAFVVVAIVGNVSSFNSCMISLSRGFYAIAEDNLAPKTIVKISSKRGVPHVAILSIAAVALITCQLDFEAIVTITVTLLMVDYVLIWISGIYLRKKAPDLKRPFKLPFGTTGFILFVIPGIIIAIVALFINGADYFLGGMAGMIIMPLLYILFKRKYGGLTAKDPANNPINPRTKLCYGDLSRMAVLGTLFTILGIAASVFMPWYEGSWGPEYYQDTYGFTGAYDFIITGILVLTVVYAVLTLIVALLSKKFDPKEDRATARKLWQIKK